MLAFAWLFKWRLRIL